MNDLVDSRGYRKPREICRWDTECERVTAPADVVDYIARGMRAIQTRIEKLGLQLRMAALDDVAAIQQHHQRCFPPETATLEDPYVLYRIIRYGYCPVIADDRGRVLGCNLCEGHDDPEKTAYGVRISVERSLAGHNLGAELVNFTCLVGMGRGARLRRGLLSPTNYGSAANFLNHVGYLAETFDPDLSGFGARFTVALPLTPGGVSNNRIDLVKLGRFMEQRRSGRDYCVVACRDGQAIERMYSDSPFRVVAFLHQGPLAAENSLLAVPAEDLRLP